MLRRVTGPQTLARVQKSPIHPTSASQRSLFPHATNCHCYLEVVKGHDLGANELVLKVWGSASGGKEERL